jgi:DNA-binding response OmpR family regulator
MGKHIMIADDEVDIVQTVRIRLEANGYQVTDTIGERTVKDVLAQKPDLLLLDIMMPGMDGFAVLRELKRYPELAGMPVIIFSAKPKSAMIELFGPEGISGYVSKPYDPQELLAEVKKVLGS